MFDGAGFQHSTTNAQSAAAATDALEEQFEEVDDIDDNGYLVINSCAELTPPKVAPRVGKAPTPTPPGVKGGKTNSAVTRLLSSIHSSHQASTPELKTTISSGHPGHDLTHSLQPVEWDALRGYQWYSPVKRKEAEKLLMAGK